jgi:hypothetical protein
MHTIQHLISGFWQRYCMYEYPSHALPELCPPDVTGLSWKLLDSPTIALTFHDLPKREAVFQRFAADGSLGVCIFVGDIWAAHAWMSVPGKARPPHIPSPVAPDTFWIYFCATKHRFAGKGLYKFAQRVLLREALTAAPQASILIDTTPDNLASRKAIISTGFKPVGMISCSYLWIPRVVRKPLACHWAKTAQHPPLPEKRQAGPG